MPPRAVGKRRQAFSCLVYFLCYTLHAEHRWAPTGQYCVSELHVLNGGYPIPAAVMATVAEHPSRTMALKSASTSTANASVPFRWTRLERSRTAFANLSQLSVWSGYFSDRYRYTRTIVIRSITSCLGIAASASAVTRSILGVSCR